MTKATLLLFNTERLIDLCPLRRVLDHNFTVFIDYVCSANPTIKTNKRKTKTLFKKIITTLRSLNGGQKMSVGVFPFMLQLLVHVRERDKNYSSIFSTFENKLQGAT